MSFCRWRGRRRLGGARKSAARRPNGLRLMQTARAGAAVTLGQKARQPPELRGSQPPFTVMRRYKIKRPQNGAFSFALPEMPNVGNTRLEYPFPPLPILAIALRPGNCSDAHVRELHERIAFGVGHFHFLDPGAQFASQVTVERPLKITAAAAPAALGRTSPGLLGKSRPVRLHNRAHDVKSRASRTCR